MAYAQSNRGISIRLRWKGPLHGRRLPQKVSLDVRLVVPLAVKMHHGQINVSLRTVRALIDWQYPQWRELPIKAVSSTGTVNAVFRLGRDLSARFPLVAQSAEDAVRKLENEVVAGRELLGHTSAITPEPVALGMPGFGYPLPWSIQTWVPGETCFERDLGTSVSFAHDIATFIKEVRALDTRERLFDGTGRGGLLTAHDLRVHRHIRESSSLIDVSAARQFWVDHRDLPPGRHQDTVNHGDLTPGNVLAADGRLAGVIDVGGLGVADQSLDLNSAWYLLENVPRRELRSILNCDDLEWARGKAWAFEQSIGLIGYYRYSNPTMSEFGIRTLRRVINDSE